MSCDHRETGYSIWEVDDRMEHARRRDPLWKRLVRDRALYLMLAPVILYFVIFRVWPILNMRLAFFDYKAKGPWVWAGLKYFNLVFATPQTWSILRNTLIISAMKYVLLFPFFVVFALMLNEMRFRRLRQYTQVVAYLPHFFSWVVIAGVWISFLHPESGGLAALVRLVGLEPQPLMTSKGAIRWILFLSEAWRSLGWDSIIFYTAILGIDVALFEAGTIDGAGRGQIIRYIVLPALVAPMTTVFILNLGFFMTAGFEQIFNFTNAAVGSVVDILDTYIYRIGLENGQYSLATAVSLIKGAVGIALVASTHFATKRLTGSGVW